MDLGLRDKVCVITGASSGIGLETARRLHAEGARVLMVARDPDRLGAAARELGAAFVSADVTDPAAPDLIINEAAAQLGGIDVLVNNAGTSSLRPLEELVDADWQQQFELNVMGPMRLMRVAAPLMAARGWGRIVNVSSSSGKRPSRTDAAYGVAKAAQLSLSRVFADRWAPYGVLVNAVAPGATRSPLWMGEGGLADQMAAASATTREEALAAVAAHVPRGRLADPAEIADVIAFLCSERAASVAGAAWSADGGTVAIII
jgi:3-oxoacyl-[acyl-carrier protein] reductase